MEWVGSPRSLPRPLLISGLASFFAFLSFNLLATALPLYFGRTLGFGLAEFGLVAGIKYLFNFLAYVLVGWAVDRAGATFYVVGSALALASGAALFVPAVLAWAFDVVPAGRHGLASAVNYLAMDAGRAVGAIGLGIAASGTISTLPFGISGALAVLAGLTLLATWSLSGNKGRSS